MPLDQDTKDYLQLLVDGINTKIDLTHKMTMREFTIVKGKQDSTNGRVKNLEAVTSILKWVNEHKILTLAIGIAFWFLIDWSSSHINYKKTIEKNAGVEFKEDK